jgi:hypothetical protein
LMGAEEQSAKITAQIRQRITRDGYSCVRIFRDVVTEKL